MGKIFWDYKQMVRLTISSFNTNQSLDFTAFIHFIGCLFDLIDVDIMIAYALPFVYENCNRH